MPKLLTPQNFKCDRYCGECCKKTMVPLSRADISRMKKAGLDEKEFSTQDPFIKSRKLLAKHDNGWCIYLKEGKTGRYTCSIHAVRPFACREYPFFGSEKAISSCLPDKLYPNVFFKGK